MVGSHVKIATTLQSKDCTVTGTQNRRVKDGDQERHGAEQSSENI